MVTGQLSREERTRSVPVGSPRVLAGMRSKVEGVEGHWWAHELGSLRNSLPAVAWDLGREERQASRMSQEVCMALLPYTDELWYMGPESLAIAPRDIRGEMMAGRQSFPPARQK